MVFCIVKKVQFFSYIYYSDLYTCLVRDRYEIREVEKKRNKEKKLKIKIVRESK